MKVWIGDPCYVLNDSDYNQCLSDFNRPHVMLCDDDDDDDSECREMFVFNTFGGDGRFNDQFGNEYCVDSGQLCIIPLENISDKTGIDSGHVFNDSEWSSWFDDVDDNDGNGTLRFGDVTIVTGWTVDDEDDED